MRPSEEERQRINELVARFETATGIEAVAAVTEKADSYPEIPWKAYAVGSAMGALGAALNPFFVSGWSHASMIALDAMLILAGGAVLSVASAFVPAIGRLFLHSVRVQAEATQYAQCMFLSRELFRTQQRRAVLIVLCRYERTAVVLADAGLTPFLPPDALRDVGSAAGRQLASGQVVAAFEVAFSKLREQLERGGFTAAPADPNAIADDVVVEKPV